MTALTGVIQQRRHWLRLLVLVGVPIVLMLVFSHHAWADGGKCNPKDEVPDLFCKPPEPKDSGKVLGIFDVVDKNGVPISAYGLNVDQGGMLDVISKIIAFLIGVGFNVLRTVIGFACWLVDWALDFGLAKDLLAPVSDVAETIRAQVIDSLGLKILFLTIVAVYAGYLILFKQRSKGWIEICTSLVIASIATVTLASPGLVLMGQKDQNGNLDNSGVLGKTRQFSLYIADVMLEDRCAKDGVSPAEKDPGAPVSTCDGQGEGKSDSDSVSKPITDGLVDAFIQRPVWLLYTHKPIDGACSAAYGRATLARYNFNRLVLPRMIEEMQEKEKNKGWLKKLGDAFSDSFSLDGLKNNLLLATGNPWAIYTVAKNEQKEAVEEFKKEATKSETWKTYISGENGSDIATDPIVNTACGDKVPMDDQQISASLDNLISVWFIALAAIIVVVLVVAVSCTFLASQIWMALEVIRAQPAMVAGILPGGGRQVMWKWVSGVVRVILAIFLSVMFLAFFLIMVIALLNANTGDTMTVKFLTIDFLAVAFLVFRKKITAAAKNVSANFGQKMAAKTGGEASTFQGATNGAPSALDQFKKDGATLSKVGGKARDLWRGKVPGEEGGSDGSGGDGGAGGGGGGRSARPKKKLKDRVQGAVKLGTTVAAAVGSGGTSAAVQATAKAALKARLKKAAQNRLQKNRVGRATLTAARAGRYLKNDAPVTRSRFRNAVAAERRNLADNTPPSDGDRRRDSQRDAARRMRRTRSRQRSDSQRLNRTVNDRRNAQRSARRSSGRGGRRTPRGGGGGGNGR